MLLRSILVSFLSYATIPAPKRLAGSSLPGFVPILVPGRALGGYTECLSGSALCSAGLAADLPAFTNSISCHHEDKYHLLHQGYIETTNSLKIQCVLFSCLLLSHITFIFCYYRYHSNFLHYFCSSKYNCPT